MHPEELKGLLERAIEGSLDAAEEAQLARLLAKEPGLAAELERMAIDSCDAHDDALDALLVRARSARTPDAADIDALSGNILEKLGRRGRVITMRRVMLGGGAIAAGLLLTATLFHESWLPVGPNPGPNDGGGPLNHPQPKNEPRVTLADGVTGFYDVQYIDVNDGVTITVERGSLLREHDRDYALLGGEAHIEVDADHEFNFFVDANRVRLRGPVAVKVTVQGSDSINTLVSMSREALHTRFETWLKQPHRDCTFELTALDASKGSALLMLGKRSQTEELILGEERFVDGERPELDAALASQNVTERRQRMMDDAFKKLDADGDGKLSPAEAGMENFVDVDRDNSGGLSPAEFRKGSRARESRPPLEERRNIRDSGSSPRNERERTASNQ